MKAGRFQAKDIDDRFFLRCIAWASYEADPPLPWVSGSRVPYTQFPHWVHTWNLQALMPAFPPEVILAKARALLRRGLITGCGCGCRGDFELTAEGGALADRDAPTGVVVDLPQRGGTGE